MKTLTFTTIFLLVAVFTQTAEAVSQESVKTSVVTELKNSAGVQYVSKDNTHKIQ
jgi:hypothetical protein